MRLNKIFLPPDLPILSLKNAYPNTFYSHFGSIKIILKNKRNSLPAYPPHIFQIYIILDLTIRCAAQNLTWCVLSAGLLQHLTWCVLSAGLFQHLTWCVLSAGLLQHLTWCVLSAGLLQNLTWCVLSAGLLQHFKISNDPIKTN